MSVVSYVIFTACIKCANLRVWGLGAHLRLKKITGKVNVTINVTLHACKMLN